MMIRLPDVCLEFSLKYLYKGKRRFADAERIRITQLPNISPYAKISYVTPVSQSLLIKISSNHSSSSQGFIIIQSKSLRCVWIYSHVYHLIASTLHLLPVTIPTRQTQSHYLNPSSSNIVILDVIVVVRLISVDHSSNIFCVSFEGRSLLSDTSRSF